MSIRESIKETALNAVKDAMKEQVALAIRDQAHQIR